MEKCPSMFDEYDAEPFWFGVKNLCFVVLLVGKPLHTFPEAL